MSALKTSTDTGPEMSAWKECTENALKLADTVKDKVSETKAAQTQRWLSEIPGMHSNATRDSTKWLMAFLAMTNPICSVCCKKPVDYVESQKFLQCSNCKMAFYCSADCKKKCEEQKLHVCS